MTNRDCLQNAIAVRGAVGVQLAGIERRKGCSISLSAYIEGIDPAHRQECLCYEAN